jgi:hypothetical protein
VVAVALPATVTRMEGRRLQSLHSVAAFGTQATVVSALAKKLRLEPSYSVAVLNAPPGYLEQLAPAPQDLHVVLGGSEVFDAVQLFVKDVDELQRLGPAAIRATKPDGLLWITYPKGGAGRGMTDLPATPWWVKRDVLGEITAETGYKPVAFVKIDDTWTALRFKRN